MREPSTSTPNPAEPASRQLGAGHIAPRHDHSRSFRAHYTVPACPRPRRLQAPRKARRRDTRVAMATPRSLSHPGRLPGPVQGKRERAYRDGDPHAPRSPPRTPRSTSPSAVRRGRATRRPRGGPARRAVPDSETRERYGVSPRRYRNPATRSQDACSTWSRRPTLTRPTGSDDHRTAGGRG
jgi:hypothetical protein